MECFYSYEGLFRKCFTGRGGCLSLRYACFQERKGHSRQDFRAAFRNAKHGRNAYYYLIFLKIHWWKTTYVLFFPILQERILRILTMRISLVKLRNHVILLRRFNMSVPILFFRREASQFLGRNFYRILCYRGEKSRKSPSNYARWFFEEKIGMKGSLQGRKGEKWFLTLAIDMPRVFVLLTDFWNRETIKSRVAESGVISYFRKKGQQRKCNFSGKKAAEPISVSTLV